ncbi:hypothetical protein [Trebonia sp.]|uniref:helix-turn-helix transcriptional regulator n=1 Tax=Trebonia sp. TaxID=2767075 RepID=UPI0026327973|nr:hypothetical protein [Trebonia sp.]
MQDDGEGFDPTAGWQGDRFGLRDLSERVRRMGATIEVDSLAGWGTRIRARFPYRQPGELRTPRLRVLIAARRPLLRAGIVRLLSSAEPGIEVADEVATIEEALTACRELRPDVALADLGPDVLSPGAGSARRPPHPVRTTGYACRMRHHRRGEATVGVCPLNATCLTRAARPARCRRTRPVVRGPARPARPGRRARRARR